MQCLKTKQKNHPHLRRLLLKKKQRTQQTKLEDVVHINSLAPVLPARLQTPNKGSFLSASSWPLLPRPRPAEPTSSLPTGLPHQTCPHLGLWRRSLPGSQAALLSSPKGFTGWGSVHSSELWKARASPPLRKLREGGSAEGSCGQGHCVVTKEGLAQS